MNGSSLVKIYDISVIGGGASGMTAALAASDENVKISIFEKNKILGKKILATGNGKCNLANIDILKRNYFSAEGDNSSYYDMISRNHDEVEKLFERLGVMVYTDNSGRKYPMSCSAKMFNDLFVREISRCKNIDVNLGTEIFKIEKYKNRWKIFSKDGGVFETRKIIFAVGGFAAPEMGTNGVSWKMLQNLGVEFSYAEPALCPLYPKENIKELKGLRVRADVKLFVKKQDHKYSEIAYEEKNCEVQFGENYISGVGIMNSTAFVRNDEIMYVSLDLAYQFKKDLSDYFLNFKKNHSEDVIETIYDGICDRRLGKYILKRLGYDDLSKKIGSLSYRLDNECDIDKISRAVKNCYFYIDKKGNWKQAQTTMGGVKSDEVSENLELKKANGIYICGEVCDIHGMCGGYNLMWAWISGKLVAEACRNNFKK